MNRASENPAHHLAVLKERLLPPSDYEKAFHYFLEEFGGDAAFMAAGTPEVMPQFEGVLNQIASKALGKPVKLEGARFNRMAEHRFRHGAAAVAGRAVIMLYFEDVNTGLMAIIPGPRGAAELARFQIPGLLTVDAGMN
jgi:hypothetical protein